jgi:hypothetical protein
MRHGVILGRVTDPLFCHHFFLLVRTVSCAMNLLVLLQTSNFLVGTFSLTPRFKSVNVYSNDLQASSNRSNSSPVVRPSAAARWIKHFDARSAAGPAPVISSACPTPSRSVAATSIPPVKCGQSAKNEERTLVSK